MRRMRHRLGTTATLVSLMSTVLLISPSAGAAICRVTNERSGTTYARAQRAIDTATRHDTLLIEGTCVGQAVIRDTALRLKGIPTAEQPIPTLDGGGVTRVLMITHARVVLRRLTITDGRARKGGAIRLREGSIVLANSSVSGNAAARDGGGLWIGPETSWHPSTVLLKGTSSLSGNTAGRDGGGLWISETALSGGVTLEGTTSVFGNTAGRDGGGLYAFRHLTLSGSASVTGNEAGGAGGGIWAAKLLLLEGSSSVSGNTAAYGGGVYHEQVGPGTGFDLDDASSVTGNTATTAGGGIYLATGYVRVCSDLVAISPNDPDDPPETQACP